jgi:hypothetical protein
MSDNAGLFDVTRLDEVFFRLNPRLGREPGWGPPGCAEKWALPAALCRGRRRFRSRSRIRTGGESCHPASKPESRHRERWESCRSQCWKAANPKCADPPRTTRPCPAARCLRCRRALYPKAAKAICAMARQEVTPALRRRAHQPLVRRIEGYPWMSHTNSG